MDAIEALDPEHACEDYWAGKADREAAAAGLPVPERAAAARAPGGAARPAGAPRRRGSGKRGRCSFFTTQLCTMPVHLSL